MSMWRLACVLGVFALTQACDAGSTSPPLPPPPDPSALELGDDGDLGADDLGPTPVELHGQLHVTGTEIRDASDKAIQLKGVSSMWLNWEHAPYAENLTALQWLRNNWHLNLIRAAVGVGQNGDYLDDPAFALKQVEQIIDNAVAAGVYVLVDWHSSAKPAHPAEAVAFFSQIADKYKGVPNVIYETFNEPLKLDWSTELKPYHEAVVAAIRESEPNSIIVLGTPNWSQDVDIAAADPLVGDNLMYTLHFYACDHGQYLINKGNSALAKGLPLFVTEWGATAADGGLDGAVCQVKAQLWLDWMKSKRIGWAAWKLDSCEPDSSCLLSLDAPIDGGWTSQYLHGHALYVRAQMQQE